MIDARRVTVELGDRTYGVMVGAGLLEHVDEVLADLREAAGWNHALLISDDNVGLLYSEMAEAGLRRLGVEVSEVLVEPGERSKSPETALRLVDSMATSLLERSDLVVALGGGVVGDLAGFAASVYKRGVDLVQLPTTLMAQVDSAIGGKTAVNLEVGKNLAGTFHQPVAVVCDVELLSTLTEREYRSGLAEVAKYTFLEPDRFPRPFEGTADRLASRGTEALLDVVPACAGIKAGTVSADEFDRGVRTHLNYGHTLGHALEAVTEYEGTYTHGEAVAVGMLFAALVAEELEVAAGGLAARHRAALERFGLPVAPLDPAPGFEVLWDHILQDKKSSGGTKMVLLEAEGRPLVRGQLHPRTLAECYARLVKGA